MAAKFIFFFASILIFSSTAGSMDIGMKRRVARTWCIANPTVNHDYLQKDMDVLCDVVDCRSIKPGGSCYEPNDVVSHASVVFNLYYKFHASQSNTCNFGGDAMLTVIDPSSGSCVYPS